MEAAAALQVDREGPYGAGDGVGGGGGVGVGGAGLLKALSRSVCPRVSVNPWCRLKLQTPELLRWETGAPRDVFLLRFIYLSEREREGERGREAHTGAEGRGERIPSRLRAQLEPTTPQIAP